MSKAELEEKIEGIFAPLKPHFKRTEHMAGNGIGDAMVGSIMLERAWIELYQLVDSLLDM